MKLLVVEATGTVGTRESFGADWNYTQRLLTPGYALTRQPLIDFFNNEKRSPQSIDEDWPDDFIYFMHQQGSETAHAAQNPHGVLGVSRALEPRP